MRSEDPDKTDKIMSEEGNEDGLMFDEAKQ